MSTVAVVLPTYVLLLDVAKRWFYRREATTPTRQASQSSRERRIARRAARWSVQTFIPDPVGRPGR